MTYRFSNNIRNNPADRAAFDALATQVFGLSFTAWYQAGYWSDRYIPYTLFDGAEAVANASVNVMDFLWQGKPRRYIQLGTVMTAPAYRQQGLARRLMQAILHDWQAQCDGMYLFANETVLEFYPKFGFERASEVQHTLPITPRSTSDIRKLDMQNAADRALLLAHYAQSNPFSALTMVDNPGLLMFYGMSFLQDCMYYLPQQDVVAVAEQEGAILHCYDIYGNAKQSLSDILSVLASDETHMAYLGFTPQNCPQCQAIPLAGEDHLFVLAGKENPFATHSLRFPALSHA